MSIHSIKPYELESALRIIRNSFATVADEFHLTKENCPGHTTFITLEKLKIKYDSGDRMYITIYRFVLRQREECLIPNNTLPTLRILRLNKKKAYI